MPVHLRPPSPGDGGPAWRPSELDTPFQRLGGWEGVRALADRFYDAMERTEPSLLAVHRQAPPGRIPADARERFGLFLQGWLGGPQTYLEQHGHPRLRMRHAGVAVDSPMRDAWLRCMAQALDGAAVEEAVRSFLDARFAEVADFLRNREG